MSTWEKQNEIKRESKKDVKKIWQYVCSSKGFGDAKYDAEEQILYISVRDVLLSQKNEEVGEDKWVE